LHSKVEKHISKRNKILHDGLREVSYNDAKNAFDGISNVIRDTIEAGL